MSEAARGTLVAIPSQRNVIHTLIIIKLIVADGEIQFIPIGGSHHTQYNNRNKRALLPPIPSEEQFRYTVCNVLSSAAASHIILQGMIH